MIQPINIEKRKNVVNNFSLIFGAAMMIAMQSALTSMAKTFAESFANSSKDLDKINTDISNSKKQIPKQILDELIDMKSQMDSQMIDKQKLMDNLLQDNSFEEGVKIAEKYDLGIPKLTENLTIPTLAIYVTLIIGEDPKATVMFREITEWLNKITPMIQEKMKNS